MAADGVGVHAVGVDFEVDPVEGEGLEEAEDCWERVRRGEVGKWEGCTFSEEGVDAEGGGGLV